MAKTNYLYLGAGILIMVVLIVFMTKVGIQGGTLAVICPTCYLGNNVTQGDELKLDVNMGLASDSKAISDLKVSYEVYGPDAFSMPCKGGPSISRTDISMDKSSVQAGQSSFGSLTIDTSTLEAGNDYSVLVYVLDGTTKVPLTYSAYDNQYYDQCVAVFGDNLAKPENGCSKNEDNQYYHCLGVAWSFNLKAQGNVTPNETCKDTSPVCDSNKSYSYFSCSVNNTVKVNCTVMGEICQAGQCVSSSCSPVNSTKNETCPSGYTPATIANKWKCSANGTWIDNLPSQKCVKSVAGGVDFTSIAIIGAGIVILLIIIGAIVRRN